MLWIHYLVGVSHFAECRENRPVTVWEMLINLLKSPIPQRWGKWKVIRNPYPGPDHHQKLINPSDWRGATSSPTLSFPKTVRCRFSTWKPEDRRTDGQTRGWNTVRRPTGRIKDSIIKALQTISVRSGRYTRVSTRRLAIERWWTEASGARCLAAQCLIRLHRRYWPTDVTGRLDNRCQRDGVAARCGGRRRCWWQWW